MRFFILNIIFVFVSIIQIEAQVNLVPNYSFEQKDSCPNLQGGIDPNCKYWFTPMSKMLSPPPYSSSSWGSSDYYNICSITNMSIPKNLFGFQYSKKGEAYAGIAYSNLGNLLNDYKEYIEVMLLKSLSYNKKYCIEFYYSISGYFGQNNYYPIKISALLTDTLVSRQSGINTPQPQNIYAIPQVSGQLPQIRDTVNWIKVSGTFIAKGGEQYLTIGNFQHTDTLTSKSVYVYIDDVKLYYCGPDTTEQPVDSLIIPNVFTPNGDGYNDKFVYKNQEQWEFETIIYNRWEVPVFNDKESQNWDGTFQGEKVSSGVYFYMIKAKAIKTGEIRVFRGTVSVFN